MIKVEFYGYQFEVSEDTHVISVGDKENEDDIKELVEDVYRYAYNKGINDDNNKDSK